MNKKDLYRKLVKEEELTKEEAMTLGDISKANLDLPFKYVFRGDKFLGAPIYSETLKNIAPICSSKRNLVAKLENFKCYHSSNFFDFLQDELQIHLQVYDESYNIKANVPQACGLYNVYDLSKRKFKIGIVMEKIEGKTSDKFKDSKNFQRIEKTIKAYERKFGEKFILDDVHPGNIIIEDKTGRIYFIDFEKWGIW